MTMRILFVCLGNICRSPMAEGIMRQIADAERFEVGSAGTSGWHNGNPPDARAIAEAARHGIDLRLQRSRKFATSDFEDFDLIVALDRKNLRDIEALRPSQNTTPVRLLSSYAEPGRPTDVPDPWYEDNFDAVFEMIEEAAEGLLRSI